VFTVPENTSSPGATSRGRLSPVSAAVFSVEVPSSTTPSIGTFSPGRTTIVLPTSTSSGSTSVRTPSTSMFALSGRMSIKSLMFFRLLPTATLWNSSPIW